MDTVAAKSKQGRFSKPQAWFRLGGTFVLIGAACAGLTAAGMIATFNRIAALKGKATPAILAEGISDSLIWVTMGMLFFWPGVLFTCIGFWKKYFRRSDNQPEATRQESVESTDLVQPSDAE